MRLRPPVKFTMTERSSVISDEYVETAWPAEKALPALARQLKELQALKRLGSQAGSSLRAEWERSTRSILMQAFGHHSDSVARFIAASHAAIRSARIASETQQHMSFDLQMQKCEAVLRNSIVELERRLADREVRGAYAPGEERLFFADLRGIVRSASLELFVIDSHLDAEALDIYLDGVARAVTIRLLTDQFRTESLARALTYLPQARIEIRSSKDAQDGLVFVDERSWVIGQSRRDAARKKPAYIVEFDASRLRPIYESIWQAATPVWKTSL